MARPSGGWGCGSWCSFLVSGSAGFLQQFLRPGGVVLMKRRNGRFGVVDYSFVFCLFERLIHAGTQIKRDRFLATERYRNIRKRIANRKRPKFRLRKIECMTDQEIV